jgi:hypothetical protein
VLYLSSEGVVTGAFDLRPLPINSVNSSAHSRAALRCQTIGLYGMLSFIFIIAILVLRICSISLIILSSVFRCVHIKSFSLLCLSNI